MKKEIIKPFDLEAYKNGAKIRTRKGREVRIICTDVKNPYYHILALIKIDDNNETVLLYTSEGKVLSSNKSIDPNDLVIVEEVEEPEFWSDKEDKEVKGYFIGSESIIIYRSHIRYDQNQYKCFASKKQAKSAKAMARISQIMANDVENFGGVITDEEWEDNYESKFVIYRLHNNISVKAVRSDYHFIAFHTARQRDLFLEKYRNLVKDFLMID